MQFAQVAATSEELAATPSRNAKVAAVARALRAAALDEVATVTAYLAGVLPQGRVGIGWRTLTSVPRPAAEPTLDVGEVDDVLSTLAADRGAGVGERRRSVLEDLLGRATAPEQALLRGLLLGDVRQGAQDGVVLKAIAAAADVPESEVRRAVMLAGFSGPVAEVAMSRGSAGLAEVGLVVGRPLRPMLAASAPDIGSAVGDAVPDVVLDGKLDGIRLQAHKRGRQVRLFTRSLDDITDRLPEVVEVVRDLPVDAAVLDGEAIALDAAGRPHPFQVTGARTASTQDPAVLRETTPVTPYFFDLLHVDGRDLVDEAAQVRFDALVDLVPGSALVSRTAPTDLGAAEDFFRQQVSEGLEGVVVKRLDAPYAAGRRGTGWVKVKPRHTVDLVVLAVEWGSGRRRGLLSNIHLGARQGDGFVMLGKTFKGMTDEMLAWQTERFLGLETHRTGHVVHVRPEQVVEVAIDGLQRSTRYPGGVALRFARVVRYRDDKTAAEADTLETVTTLLP